MTRGNFSRMRRAQSLMILCVLVLLCPAFTGTTRATSSVQISTIPISFTGQPSTQDLEAAFDLVGRGATPPGYPSSAEGLLVPTSLLKAIAWTESHWRQFDASLQPLKSMDGGFGIMQITSGMNSGALPVETSSAIANNFLYNIAFGAQLLISKWQSTPAIGDRDASIIEHWYYALWAYNGWGWVNNPNNPRFTRVATPETNPATWPYQERVLYWLAHPPTDEQGILLWPAVDVTLPNASDIGRTPKALAEVTVPHRDIPMAVSSFTFASASSSETSTLSNAAFVSDNSIPDGQILQPGEQFRKVWLLKNKGSDSWGPGYTWQPLRGSYFGNTAGVPVPVTAPFAQAMVSVDLVAPSVPGSYRQYWQMVDPHGKRFGVQAWVDIRVVPPSSLPSNVAPSGTSGPIFTNDTAPSITPIAASLVTSQKPAVFTASTTKVNGDEARYAGDINIPDGTVLSPGQHFVKTWKIQNTGTTIWSSAYHWHFESGTLMSTIQTVSVPRTPPGSTALISVAMVAPTATGVYTSFWDMSNASGHTFPHQAWVNIVVRDPSVSPPTVNPKATSTPGSMNTPAAGPTPQPTIALPGGNGQLTASPWIGTLGYRTFFPAGTTIPRTQETLGFYYPGKGVAHVHLTLYRPDAAQRMISFTLASGEHHVFSLNSIAPGTGLSVATASDRFVVVQRSATSATTMLTDPGAARTARSWTFPGVPTNTLPVQRLVFFNPHDTPTQVTVRIGLPRGGCCAAISKIQIPPLLQYNYDLGTSAALHGPITILGDDVVAVERVLQSSDGVASLSIPGTAGSATRWYLPSLHSTKDQITVFNPGTRSVSVTIRSAQSKGPGGYQQRSVPPFSQVRVPLSLMTSSTYSAAEVVATGPILVAADHSLTNEQSVSIIGGTFSAKGWTLFAGLAGKNSRETLEIMNPSDKSCTVTVDVVGSRSASGHWTMRLAPHSSSSRPLAVASGSVLVAHATQPIVVGKTTTAGASNTVSALGLPLPTL